MNIDYQDLLRKYMAIVADAEGYDFLTNVGEHAGPYRVTADELTLLRKVSAEVDKDYERATPT